MTPSFKIKNWEKLQHYKSKNGEKPVWLKLYRDLLDDFEFHSLPVESRALLPMLWLIAGEDGGRFSSDIKKIAFRLRQSVKEIEVAIKPLISSSFIESIGIIEPLYNDPIPEDIDKKNIDKKNIDKIIEESFNFDSNFEECWKLYPNTSKKGSKCAAKEKYVKLIRKGEKHEAIISGIGRYRNYCADGTFNQHFTTWINQNGWKDEWDTLHKPPRRDNQGQKPSYMDQMQDAGQRATDQINRELDASNQENEKFCNINGNSGRVPARITHDSKGTQKDVPGREDRRFHEEGDCGDGFSDDE